MNRFTLPMGAAMSRNMSELQTQRPAGEETASWISHISQLSFTWATEGGDFGTADWGCLAGRCASLCLQAAHGGHAAGGSS